MSSQTSHRERLDIYELTIQEIKALIKTNIKNTIACWESGKEIDKQTFHIIGDAGVGKTSSAHQLAEELTQETGKSFSMIKIQSPVLSRDDLLCPFPEIKKEKFKMLLSDFIPTDPNSYGLFVIDEMSRGDHNLQQLMWQIMNEQMIHTYAFPKGWFVLCVDNPDDEGYSMNYIEDGAGLRRSCHLYCGVSVRAFIEYARKTSFHPLVTNFIEANPDKLYDHEAKKLGRVFANPASWEKVSNILCGYDTIGKDGITSNMNNIEVVAGGLLNASMSRYFMDFVTDNTKSINPEDIFYIYDTIRSKIIDMSKNTNNPRLADTASALTEWIFQKRIPIEEITDKIVENIINFLTDIPIDITAMFFAAEHEKYNVNQDGFFYLIDFNDRLHKSPRYVEEIEKPQEEITREALKRKNETLT